MDRAYESEKWYQIDLLLDWDRNLTALFVDGEFIKNVDFYSRERDMELRCDATFVNTLALYSLTPGSQS